MCVCRDSEEMLVYSYTPPPPRDRRKSACTLARRSSRKHTLTLWNQHMTTPSLNYRAIAQYPIT